MTNRDPSGEVTTVCTRMAWLTDRRDWDRLASVFASEVVVDYSSLQGGAPQRVTSAQLIAGWRDALGELAATQHLLSSFQVEIEGDRATSTADFQATHVGHDPFGGRLWVLGGNYRFALVRSEGDWRITELTMTAVWGRGNRNIMSSSASDAASRDGRRSSEPDQR